MNTYILDVGNRIRRFGEKFNVSTTLCDKSWIVFNDSEKKEVYVFQPDGSLFITSNGIGTKGKWYWVSDNNMLIINNDDKNVQMFHPELIDDSILALTLDGTNQVAFLFEQGNKKAFAAESTHQPEQCVIEKIQQLYENKRQQDERAGQKQGDEQEQLKEEAKQLSKQLKNKCFPKYGCISGVVLFILIWIAFRITRIFDFFIAHPLIAFFLVICIIVAPFIIIEYEISNRYKKNRDKWINENKGDPRIEFLDKVF